MFWSKAYFLHGVTSVELVYEPPERPWPLAITLLGIIGLVYTLLNYSISDNWKICGLCFLLLIGGACWLYFQRTMRGVVLWSSGLEVQVYESPDEAENRDIIRAVQQAIASRR